MGLGWVFLIRGDPGWVVLAYWLDHIVSAVLAGWIGSDRCNLCIAVSLDIYVSLDISGTGTGSYRIIMAGCKGGTDGTDGTDGNDGNDGLDGALVGLGWTVVSTRRNRSDRTGEPPLAGWLLQTRDKWDRWT